MRAGGPAGFTIVEMIVVLVIAGILTTMALPRFSLTRYRMDGAVRGMATTMIYAQRVAVKRQHNVVVRFDVTEGLVRIHQDDDNDGTVDSGERERVVRLQEGVLFGLEDAPARGMGSDAVSFSADGGMPAVTFHRNGSTNEEGGFYLTSERAYHGDHPGDARAVEISRSTGRVAWYRYRSDENAWEQGL